MVDTLKLTRRFCVPPGESPVYGPPTFLRKWVVHGLDGAFALGIDKLTSADSYSEVFAARIEAFASSNELRLTHPTDTSVNVRYLLDVIDRPPSVPIPLTSLWQLVSLIPLLQRYEFDTLLARFKGLLRRQANDSSPGKIFVFLAAARLPNHDICASAIQHGGRETWSEVLRQAGEEVEEQVGIERDSREMGCFDIRGWSEAISTRILGPILSALFAALRETDIRTDGGDRDWATVAQEFRRLG
jgi:hypothetical protein